MWIAIITIILLPVLYFLPTKNNSQDANEPKVITKTATGIAKILSLLVLGGGYLLVTMLSAFASDSCGISSDCTFLNLGFNLGVIYLLVSFIFTALLIFSPEKHLPIFLRPYVAVPLYIVIIFLSLTLDSM